MVIRMQPSSPCQTEPNPVPPGRLRKSTQDYYFGKTIGEGSFSTVFKARDVHNKDSPDYAIKCCEKMIIQKERKVAAIMREKEIMNILNQHPSPFFVKLLASFQDETRLFFVMNYASNGELLFHMQRLKQFDNKCAVFYSGEIILALEHIHGLGIIHRDLKPENILLNEKMHIQITDFGSAMIEDPSRYKIDSKPDVTGQPLPAVNSNRFTNDRRSSFVGTAQYVSPEVLCSKKATNACDIWALGCIMYQMVSGKFPFRAATEYLIFKKIQNLEYSFPDGFDETAKSLIKDILVIDPEKRKGIESFKESGHYSDIRNHEFFVELESRWETLHKEVAPLEPSSSSDADVVDLELELENLNPGFTSSHYLDPSHRGQSKEEDWCTDPSDPVFKRKLEKQAKEHEYHRFVEGNLILKEGFLVKTRERRFKVRRRWFLLTTGPGLYYVDTKAKILKGFVPWSATLKAEVRDFRKFYVHTPGRTYNLEDPDSGAGSWVEDINRLKEIYFKSSDLDEAAAVGADTTGAGASVTNSVSTVESATRTLQSVASVSS